MDRRRFLVAGFAMAPLAGMLAACGRKGDWPEGMQEIKWDRDTCVVCNMVISDRRFAGEMRGGPKNIVFKFDDPGCVALWLDDKAATYPWIRDPATRLWLADVNSRGQNVTWLDGRKAQYVTKTSPMGFNFGAVAHAQAGSVDFPTMCEHVVTKFKKGRT
jgi:nitrous oxide reductase accessory protein NosL